MTDIVDVHVQNLRKMGYSSLEEWLENPDHIYVGRHVAYVRGTYSSKWRNIFSSKTFGLKKCLEEYEKYLIKSRLIQDIEELRGKTLGCWCTNTSSYENPCCHAQILLKYLHQDQKT